MEGGRIETGTSTDLFDGQYMNNNLSTDSFDTGGIGGDNFGMGGMTALGMDLGAGLFARLSASLQEGDLDMDGDVVDISALMS